MAEANHLVNFIPRYSWIRGENGIQVRVILAKETQCVCVRVHVRPIREVLFCFIGHEAGRMENWASVRSPCG